MVVERGQQSRYGDPKRANALYGHGHEDTGLWRHGGWTTVLHKLGAMAPWWATGRGGRLFTLGLA